MTGNNSNGIINHEKKTAMTSNVYKEGLEMLMRRGPTVVLLALCAYIFWNKAESSNQFVIKLLLEERVEMRKVIEDNTKAMRNVSRYFENKERENAKNQDY